MSRTLTAPAHPIVLAAVGLIVANDFVLRGWAPGWFTGKASDVAWLVIAPVLLAAVGAFVGLAERRARVAALVVSVTAFTLLQLWPPLGHAFQAGHVADPEDLLALPAVLGAVVAWRGRSRASALLVPVLGASLVADDWAVSQPASWPCADSGGWNADDPLRLQLSTWGGWTPVDTDAFLQGMRLVDGDGQEVRLVATHDSQGVAVCARDGLRGDTDYTWEIGPWDAASTNEVRYGHSALPTVHFHTAPGDGPPAPDAAACAALAVPLPAAVEAACDPWDRDTGDTGDSGVDTGDSGDSGVDTGTDTAVPP